MSRPKRHNAPCLTPDDLPPDFGRLPGDPPASKVQLPDEREFDLAGYRMGVACSLAWQNRLRVTRKLLEAARDAQNLREAVEISERWVRRNLGRRAAMLRRQSA